MFSTVVRHQVLFAALCASSASAQMIGKGDTVTLALAPTDKLAARQVYALAPAQMLRELERQLTGAGLVVAPSLEAARVTVAVLHYDSGPYMGFTKTARIGVSYRLVRAGTDTKSWDDACEAKAGVDVQDAPDRNRTAVSMCLTALGARLAEALAGPTAEVLVE